MGTRAEIEKLAAKFSNAVMSKDFAAQDLSAALARHATTDHAVSERNRTSGLNFAL